MVRKSKQFQLTLKIQDPVHGELKLPAQYLPVLNTQVVQKMKQKKQLVQDHVYPGANHTRFAHSQGVSHLARRLCRELQQKTKDLNFRLEDCGKVGKGEFQKIQSTIQELHSNVDHANDHVLDDRTVFFIGLAALLHDIGHPGTSHDFEKQMHAAGYKGWSHEDQSTLLVEVVFKECAQEWKEKYAFTYTEMDVQFVKMLINPPKDELKKQLEEGVLHEKWESFNMGRPFYMSFVYEIVSNWRTGFDVDKLDYFIRDAQFAIGEQTGKSEIEKYLSDQTPQQILVEGRDNDDESAMVLNVIQQPLKRLDSIREIQRIRKVNHEKIYQHKTVKKKSQHLTKFICAILDVKKVMNSKGEMVTLRQQQSLEREKFDAQQFLRITDNLLEECFISDDYATTKEEKGKISLMNKEHELAFVKRNYCHLKYKLGYLTPEMKAKLNTKAQRDYLIKFAREVAKDHWQKEELSPQQKQFLENQQLLEECIIVEKAKIDMGAGTKDPMEDMVFLTDKYGSENYYIGTLYKKLPNALEVQMNSTGTSGELIKQQLYGNNQMLVFVNFIPAALAGVLSLEDEQALEKLGQVFMSAQKSFHQNHLAHSGEQFQFESDAQERKLLFEGLRRGKGFLPTLEEIQKPQSETRKPTSISTNGSQFETQLPQSPDDQSQPPTKRPRISCD